MDRNVYIQKNSFYDVNQKKYSEEEKRLYHELAGMPLFDSYDELINSLKIDGSEEHHEVSKEKVKIFKDWQN